LEILNNLKGIILFYISGYLFGALLGTLYNDFVYIFIHLFNCKKIKNVFNYNLQKKFNVIKSPDKKEMTTPYLLRKDDFDDIEDFKAYTDYQDKRHLYDYQIDSAPKHPYTIAFIANPKVKYFDKHVDCNDPNKLSIKNMNAIEKVEDDPIIENPELFVKSLCRALQSFEMNEVLGRPEIWSRVRILTVFDEDLITDKLSASARFRAKKDAVLAHDSEDDIVIDGQTAHKLLIPAQNLNYFYKEMLKRAKNDDPALFQIHSEKKYQKETDVIFVLSGNLKCTRSTAIFSDYNDTPSRFEIQPVSQNIIDRINIAHNLPTLGLQIPFQHAITSIVPDQITEKYNIHNCRDYIKANLSPKLNKSIGDLILSAILWMNIPQSINAGKTFRYSPNPKKIKGVNTIENQFRLSKHEFYYNVNPGRVALNVLSAGNKTYIHEFAHAMSSAINGAIDDEYFDELIVKNQSKYLPIPFFINRIVRRSNIGDIPIHKKFINYNKATFFSDFQHPSQKENWKSYFPERRDLDKSCTMDRNYGEFCFDELLINFIYDRLLAKIHRK
jgi:hypothetical protein